MINNYKKTINLKKFHGNMNAKINFKKKVL